MHVSRIEQDHSLRGNSVGRSLARRAHRARIHDAYRRNGVEMPCEGVPPIPAMQKLNVGPARGCQMRAVSPGLSGSSQWSDSTTVRVITKRPEREGRDSSAGGEQALRRVAHSRKDSCFEEVLASDPAAISYKIAMGSIVTLTAACFSKLLFCTESLTISAQVAIERRIRPADHSARPGATIRVAKDVVLVPVSVVTSPIIP